MYLALKNSDELLCANALLYFLNSGQLPITQKYLFCVLFLVIVWEVLSFLFSCRPFAGSLYVDFLTYCVFNFQLKISCKRKSN